jgi:small subunit ribosomal protein S1
VECVVLRVDEEEKKISLGMKQTEEDPWLALPAKYPPGTRISGVVRNLTSFGAFVEVEPGIDGLVHISDMSWTRRVQHPSEIVRKGEEVDVVVLNIDPDQKRISLGLKQTEEDPWYELAQKYEPGTEVSGSVVRLLDKGVVVDLGDDVEGFVPISQLGVDEDLEDPSMKFVEGDHLDLKVLESDPINRRIVLAVTELSDEIKDRPLGAANASPAGLETEGDEAAEGAEGDEAVEEADVEQAEAEATDDAPEATAEAAVEEEAEEAAEADEEAESEEAEESEEEDDEAPKAKAEEASDEAADEADDAEEDEEADEDEEEES